MTRPYQFTKRELVWEVTTILVHAENEEDARRRHAEGDCTSEHDEYDYDIGQSLTDRETLTLDNGFSDDLYPCLVISKSKFYLLNSQCDLAGAANHFEENAWSFREHFGNRTGPFAYQSPSQPLPMTTGEPQNVA